MKQGVATAPWGVWNRPQRARLAEQRAVVVKRNGGPV
jgi:hypothetical protein